MVMELRDIPWIHLLRALRGAVTVDSIQEAYREVCRQIYLLPMIGFQHLRHGISILWFGLSLTAKRILVAHLYMTIFMFLVEMTKRVDISPGWKNLSIQGVVTVIWIGLVFIGYLIWPGITEWG
jgi:hypothetical protein